MAALGLALLGSACRPATRAGPITLVDDGGHSTVLSAPASRIVSLVPATTELLFALGAGPRVVGRTQWCDYPAEAKAVPSVGDGMTPNVEAIVARNPDLVALYRSSGNGAAVSRLRELGIPVVELSIDRLKDFDRAARLLARATGRESTGDSLVTAIRERLERVTRRDQRPLSIFVLAWDQPPMTLGAGSFLTEIIDRAGARNAFESESRPSFVVSIEAVAARDPDRILVVGMGEPAIAGRPEWRSVRAVRERRFVRVEGSMFDRPSPRMPDAVEALARALGEPPK
jgi:ABC-type Fe3+-hydroxamate transport system substrate-binding protein